MKIIIYQKNKNYKFKNISSNNKIKIILITQFLEYITYKKIIFLEKT